MAFTTVGLILATIGSVLLGWSMIWPPIWLTRKQADLADLIAVLNAAKEGRELHPDSREKAADWANRFHEDYVTDLKVAAARRVGLWGVGLLAAGFILQLIGTLRPG